MDSPPDDLHSLEKTPMVEAENMFFSLTFFEFQIYVFLRVELRYFGDPADSKKKVVFFLNKDKDIRSLLFRLFAGEEFLHWCREWRFPVSCEMLNKKQENRHVAPAVTKVLRLTKVLCFEMAFKKSSFGRCFSFNIFFFQLMVY